MRKTPEFISNVEHVQADLNRMVFRCDQIKAVTHFIKLRKLLTKSLHAYKRRKNIQVLKVCVCVCNPAGSFPLENEHIWKRSRYKLFMDMWVLKCNLFRQNGKCGGGRGGEALWENLWWGKCTIFNFYSGKAIKKLHLFCALRVSETWRLITDTSVAIILMNHYKSLLPTYLCGPQNNWLTL